MNAILILIGFVFLTLLTCALIFLPIYWIVYWLNVLVTGYDSDDRIARAVEKRLKEEKELMKKNTDR